MEQQGWLQITKVGRSPLDRVHDVRLRDEQVFPAVVVIVEKVGAPTGESSSGATDPGTVRHIPKRAGALIAKQHVALVGKVCDKYVG